MSDINIEGNMWTSYLTDQVEVLTGNSSTVVGGFLSFVTLGGSVDLTIGAEATEINVAALLMDVNMGYQFESSAGGGFEKNLSPLGTEAPALEYVGTTEISLLSLPSSIILEPESIVIDALEIMGLGTESITFTCGASSIVVSLEGIQIFSGEPISIISEELSIESETINLTGDVSITGGLTVTGDQMIVGDLTMTGDIDQTGMLSVAGACLFE